MYIENTKEWWKLKIYHEVSEYLNHPTEVLQSRLISVLATYRECNPVDMSVCDLPLDGNDQYKQFVSG